MTVPTLVFTAGDFKPSNRDAEPPPDDMPPPPGVDDYDADSPLCKQCLDEGIVTPLFYGGRGRKPTKCERHKGRPASGGRTGKAPAAPRPKVTSADARAEMIVGNLLEGVGALSASIVMVAPVTANTMVGVAPEAIEGLVSVAEKYPRMLEGLEKAAQVVPFIQIGKGVAAVMLAVMVDLGQIRPDGLAPQYLGVTDAAMRAGWRPRPQSYYTDDGEFVTAEPNTNTETRRPTPPPAFTMVP